ncbi:unnamed protein product [Caenorhabditis auriculariae]|uniref:Uncharacterized protein n=1 Tax=Caenorhabditis auriculariae TaxID=2777116 RepID=A0A8S1GNG5_9PELO|nr:unnamed protein product [Caenorhabditis auriculariae]
MRAAGILNVFVPLVFAGHILGEYTARDGLAGHAGLFAVLDWSDSELATISAMHATASYHELIQLVKDKLDVSDISEEDRRKVEKFLRNHRPPPVFRTLLTEDLKDEIRKHHSEKDVDSVLAIIGAKLSRLPTQIYRQAVEYIQRHSPVY